MSSNSGDHAVFYKIHGISRARILGQALVVIAGYAVDGIEDDIFQHAAEADGMENLRLVLFREPNALRVTSAREVEAPGRTPAVLVVTDQTPCGISREGGLSCAR